MWKYGFETWDCLKERSRKHFFWRFGGGEGYLLLIGSLYHWDVTSLN